MWRIGNGKSVQAIGADCGSRQLLSTECKHQTYNARIIGTAHTTFMNPLSCPRLLEQDTPNGQSKISKNTR